MFDPYAELEDPKSSAFKDAVADAARNWSAALKPVAAAARAWSAEYKKLLTTALPHAPEFAQETIEWNGHIIKVQHSFGHRLHVWIDGSPAFQGLSDFGIDPESSLYYTIKDASKGGEDLELTVYDLESGKVWAHPNVGPAAAFSGAHLYYQSVENELRYPVIFRVNKNNGKSRAKVFEERDKRFQVELLQPPRQPHVFIKTFNALAQRIGVIHETRVRWNTSKLAADADGAGTTLIPISPYDFATNTHIVLDGDKTPLPAGQYIEDAVYLTKYELLITTVSKGRTNLYIFDTVKKAFNRLFESQVPNEIMLHRLASRPTVAITHPAEPNKVFEVVDGGLVLRLTLPCPVKLTCITGFAGADEVPFTIVSATPKPKKLLVEGYGAYGISSARRYPMHWLPWLKRGYAVAVAAPRGGRDNGDDWYDAGRTALRKHHTFEDTAAVIQAVQKRLRIGAKKTIFYGRSAGGWLAAAIGQHYSHLVGATYAEVPYLDVLRTTTNPDLPLTQLEYDEFGNPAARPDEYAALQKISPVDSVPMAPAGAPFILVRTALHDIQVLPYEALKWSKKSAALGWRIIVGVDDDGGHFAAEKDMYEQLGEDAAILDNVISKGRRYTCKLRAQTSRGTRRRRTSSLKH